MNRITRPLALAVAALLAALLALSGALLFAWQANALPVVGHGFGHTWRADGRSWLGSHRLSDGNLGLCLQVQNMPPEGADVQYQLGTSLGWVSADDAARLAYFARRWSDDENNDAAASAQLATWNITGLGAHDLAWYAQRANEAAPVVLARAISMREVADAPLGASRGVTAKITLAVPGAAAGTVRSDVIVDYLNGGPTRLAAGRHTGTLTLNGATFSDGTTNRQVKNGQTFDLVPSAGTALSDVTADVTYSDLAYGDSFYVAKAPTGVQSLLVPPPGGLTARAHAHGGDVSPLPFAPAVKTETSSARSDVGAHLFDSLELGLAPRPKLVADGVVDGDPLLKPDGVADGSASLIPPTTLSEWGVYRDEEGALQPVPVVIRSTLWGPFTRQPAPAPDVPPGAPLVCAVSTLADDGPGHYRTPDCILSQEGFYVWTERIDPADTPVSKGRDRVGAWASPFGVLTEVTLAVTPPPPPVITETPVPTPPVGPPVAPPTSPSSTNPPAPSTAFTSQPQAVPRGGGSGHGPSLASTGVDSRTIEPWLLTALALVAAGAVALLSRLAHGSPRRRG